MTFAHAGQRLRESVWSRLVVRDHLGVIALLNVCVRVFVLHAILFIGFLSLRRRPKDPQRLQARSYGSGIRKRFMRAWHQKGNSRNSLPLTVGRASFYQRRVALERVPRVSVSQPAVNVLKYHPRELFSKTEENKRSAVKHDV